MPYVPIERQEIPDDRPSHDWEHWARQQAHTLRRKIGGKLDDALSLELRAQVRREG